MKRTKTSLLFVAVSAVLALCEHVWAMEGMVSYWTFDEGEGITAFDSVGDNHGTVNGATWTSSGQVNGALSFDGVDDYVAGSDAGFPLAQDGMTFVAWIKPDLLNPSALYIIFEYGTANWNNAFSFGIYQSMWYVDSYGNNNKFGTPVAGQWSFITITTSGTTALVYVNGVYITSFSLSFSTVLNTYYIGGRGAGYSYVGLADELAIWNRILSASEIQGHYQNGLNGYGYLPVEPKTIAINNINRAIAEKVDALERIDTAIAKEWAAVDALDEMLASGDYGDFGKGDIIKAKRELHVAIKTQEPARKALEMSIEKLEDTLAALGQ